MSMQAIYKSPQDLSGDKRKQDFHKRPEQFIKRFDTLRLKTIAMIAVCLLSASATMAQGKGGGSGFKGGANQSAEYAYDANGNLTKDLNRNIVDIQYNCLNLPSKVTFGDGNTISYVYAADGTKLRTTHVIGNDTTVTDYCGNVVYENKVPKYLLTGEGYVTLADNVYHYYVKDHQGNIRVVVDQDGKVEEVNHYYPFGGIFASSGNAQPYKYNGKELDTKNGLNLYDYGARHYDPALGRFTTMDPMAEKYYPMSPYAYCGNNPVRNIDVGGRKIVDVNRNVIYNPKTGWSKDAPADAVRLGNAMMQTRTGTTQFNKMVNAPHDIMLRISPESYIQKSKKGTKYVLGRTTKHFANDKLDYADIVVYEGTLAHHQKQNTLKTKNYKVSAHTNDEAIGAIATHESVHATDERNIKESKENHKNRQKGINTPQYDTERVPEEAENNVLRELFNKYNQLKPNGHD